MPSHRRMQTDSGDAVKKAPRERVLPPPTEPDGSETPAPPVVNVEPDAPPPPPEPTHPAFYVALYALPAAGLLLAVVLLMVAGRSSVMPVADQAESQEESYLTTVNSSADDLVAGLDALQVPTATIHGSRSALQKAEGDARLPASDLLLQGIGDALRQKEIATPGSTRELAAKVDKLRDQRAAVETSLKAWDDVASGFPGSIAVSLWLAPAPPER